MIAILCMAATVGAASTQHIDDGTKLRPIVGGESITLAQSLQCETFDGPGGKCTEPRNEVSDATGKVLYTRKDGEAFTGTYNGKDDITMFEAFDGQNNCMVTGKKPRQPRSLSFCHKFNDEACCAPQMDAEITETFNWLTGTGLSCRIRGDIREDPLAQWFCMGCDPEQPKYVRSVPHASVISDSGDPSPTGDEDSISRDGTLLMCQKWAYDSFGTDPILAGPNNRFDLCGLLKSSPCTDVNGTIIDGRDPYVCGDDLVIPSNHVKTKDGSVLITASIEAFLNLDTMGPPMLNEDYYFKLVDEDGCAEDDLIALYKGLGTDVEDLLNYLPSPDCIRSKDQLIKTEYFFGGSASARTYQDYFCDATAGETCSGSNAADCTKGAEYVANPCCCGVWEAEQCFDSAHGLTPLTLVTTLAAAVAAFMML